MLKQYTKAQIALNERLTAIQNDEEGAGLVEYGLLVVGIAVIAMVGVKVFGDEVNDFFDGLGGQIGLTTP